MPRAVSSPVAPASAPAVQPQDFIVGMAKGMAVLESFDTQRQRLNATLAASRAGITRAAARRHLLTLAHLGYLETDGSWYWLAPKVLGFAGSYLATARLPRTVQPVLNRLAAQTRLAYSAAVLDQREVVIVARSAPQQQDSARLLAHGLHLGSRLPAHATSTGRVLLAALPARAQREWLKAAPLARLTAHTQCDARILRATLAQVQRDDCCLAAEEHELGVQALAVPLRDAQGRVPAALNVVGAPATLADPPRQRELLALLQDAARELRALL